MPDSPPYSPRIGRFDLNTSGRDFVVGDIHGMFPHLETLLDQVTFDPDRDRLFSVGDLVDRGPRSRDALGWLAQPWFHACRGNHEQFVLDSNDDEQRELWVGFNGGDWWLDLSVAEHEIFKEAVAAMPLAMELQTDSGLVGIVHADAPPECSWDSYMALLEAGDEDALFYALWSRGRVSGQNIAPVEGRMGRIYCGHTPTKEAVLVGNVFYIDTGAVYSYEGYADARLTMVQIQPERHIVHAVRTSD